METQTERTFTEVVQDIVQDVQNMIRSEVRLAKVEFKEEAAKAGKAAGILAAGALLALYSGGFLLLALVRALQLAMAAWLASLVVAVLVAAGAAIAITMGRKQLKRVHATPDKTIQSVKENVEWVKEQTK